MRLIVTAPVALLLMLALGSTSAPAAAPAASIRGHHTQFSWKDAAGIPHYSDTLTADALQYGYDVLNDKGLLIKHVDRQRTPEELFAEEAAAAKAATAKREAEVQALSDKRMLDAYPTEKDLANSRQAQLDSIDQNIRAATNSLGVQERSLSDTLAHADSMEHSGKPIPESLQKQIESLRKSAEALRAYIGRQQREKAAAAKRYESDLERYREARERKNVDKP
jgi:hypothetical protein